ncbi:histidine phosphatase family protein [Lactobacillus sp. ESL0701]|uniref:histidine phosphatase family protein n=1 Tax=Lactobacillus sp. ESL0701 TaxID=2983217 RepID=UPI0023F8FCF6|nr:histidine phosphatase family protein [Lactobacillus sp. ESL0701]MDF7673054.1 histidine phosphatase family protein [Lactobacillus sp. ESL0701]
MTTIYLIRHGEPDTSVHDDWTRPLTRLGQQQAQEIADKFKNVSLTAIYSSPFNRAVATVTPLAQQQNLIVQTSNLLIERRMPEWFSDAQAFDEYTRQQWRDFTYTAKGGESLAEAQTRYLDFLMKIPESGTVAIGTHGTVMSLVYDAAHHGQGFNLWQNLPYTAILKLKVFANSIVNSSFI